MDVDENSLDASTTDPHQLLKANQSPQHSHVSAALKLTNGSFGMEAEDSDHSNESLLKQKDDAVKKDETQQPLDVSTEQGHLNGVEEHLPPAELSPSLRRSTRASALKAQEKIKSKDGTVPSANMVDSHVAENGPTPTPTEHLTAQTTAADIEQQLEIPVKKQKLSDAGSLDQYDCKFGIKLDDDGDVVMMTDGSEISSLNEEEAVVLRQKYKEITSREDSEMSLEKTKEREFQVRDLESALRLEEAKLSMLKKIRANQQLAVRNTLQENARRLASTINQNVSGNAYKPSIAQQQSSTKINGSVNVANKKNNKATRPSISPAGNFTLTPEHQQLLKKLVEQGNLRPDQLATILHSLNPAALAALSQNSNKAQQQQREQQEREQKLREQQEKDRKLRLEQEAQRKAAAEAAETARLARENAQNTQQRIAAARTQLRRHLEQQLLQLPPPKPPASDLSFIPNANQPDFLYLLGLDLVVQRNLKDKTVFKKVDFDPYCCEECGTDFTPNWKAIAGDKGDLHLYCEQCVRQAQKRKIRHERTILYKKAFQKIAEQEKEFERQVNSGKFNDTSSTSTTSKESATTSTPSQSKTSTFNAASLSGLTGSANKSFNQTSSSASSNSANRNLQSNFGNRNQVKQEPPKKSVPNVQQQQQASRKRPNQPSSSSSSSSSSNNMAAFAALAASNPNALQMLQQMSNMPAALRNVNPMLASLMSNPQLMTQFYAQMLQSQNQSQQRANTSSSNNSSSSSGGNNNMSALLQAFAQQGQRNTSSSSNHSSSHHQSSGSGNSSSSNNASSILSQMSPALLQQLVAAAQRKK